MERPSKEGGNDMLGARRISVSRATKVHIQISGRCSHGPASKMSSLGGGREQA